MDEWRPVGKLSRYCRLLGHYNLWGYNHKIRRAPDGRGICHLGNVLEEIFSSVFEWVDWGEAQRSQREVGGQHETSKES